MGAGQIHMDVEVEGEHAGRHCRRQQFGSTALHRVPDAWQRFGDDQSKRERLLHAVILSPSCIRIGG